MATEAQIAANRLNATKSTGPRTEAGKAASRRNALVHGLAGEGVVLPDEMGRELDERLADWAEQLRPAGSVEAFLVRSAATESVKYDHATRHRFATIAHRVRHAEGDWDAGRRRKVAYLVNRLAIASDPGPIVRALQETAEGCAWMIGQWQTLDAQADDSGRWFAPHLAMCLTLLGEQKDADASRPEARRWTELKGAIEPVPRLHRMLDREDLTAEEEAEVNAYAVAITAGIEALRTAIAEEVARLSALRSDLEETLDGPDRAEAGRRALFEAKEDMPLRRYETASLREVSRALDQLAKLRKGREAAEKIHQGGTEGTEKDKKPSGKDLSRISLVPPCLRGESAVPAPRPGTKRTQFRRKSWRGNAPDLRLGHRRGERTADRGPGSRPRRSGVIPRRSGEGHGGAIGPARAARRAPGVREGQTHGTPAVEDGSGGGYFVTRN